MPWQRIYSAAVEQSNAVNAAADRSITRADMASFYADAIIADKLARRDGLPRVDFGAVNAAILRRWARSGLERIKRLAWAEVERVTGAIA